MADLNTVLLAVLVGALAAIVYSLRVLVMIDRKVDALCEKQGISIRELERHMERDARRR